MSQRNRNQIDEQVKLPKSQKPEPTTYLSKKYIKNHLQLFEDTGVVKIMAEAPEGQNGVKGGTYVMTGKELNNMISKANGDTSKIEKALGFDEEYLGSNPVIASEDSVDITKFSGFRSVEPFGRISQEKQKASERERLPRCISALRLDMFFLLIMQSTYQALKRYYKILQ